MIPDRRGPIPEKTLQDYLRALEENADLAAEEREEKLLRAYGELQFSLRGGARCVCGAHVRHALPVTVEHAGNIKKYDCLCVRCLAAEKGSAGEVTLRVGQASFHDSDGPKQARAGSKVQAKPFRSDAPVPPS